ncbi:hypothetical protein EGW08_015116 [Elysia chlorotica]|uniref:Peptidyl-prolyl cis-trans isomerase n=1 Tax=Elysia chlorotica TaxID=188477 RepID=A0A433T6B6_ELYCH|nr:hypothetical protein EGW08_015116 [Elysia chlorotica]
MTKVFLDFAKDGKLMGRVEIELFSGIVPKTCENFRALCTGEKGFGFRGREVNHSIPQFLMEVAGIGKSIYGPTFDDENFDVNFDAPGIVAMANQGRNSNNDRFYITFSVAEWLNGKNVAFGKVVKGMEFVKIIEKYGSVQGIPTAKFTIVDCGEL